MTRRIVRPLLCLALVGCHSPSSQPQGKEGWAVVLRSAPLLQFRGAQSAAPDQPGDTDCNSPAHWDGKTLYLFNSAGHPWCSAGSDALSLTNDSAATNRPKP